jgi:hypothetical protein
MARSAHAHGGAVLRAFVNTVFLTASLAEASRASPRVVEATRPAHRNENVPLERYRSSAIVGGAANPRRLNGAVTARA